MDSHLHRSLKEATATLLRQGKVEDVLNLSLDYIFSMLSQHSDRLDKLEHSQQRLKVHTQAHMRNLNEAIHATASRFEPALASKCEEIHVIYEKAAEDRAAIVRGAAQERTQTVIKKDEARGAMLSAVERHEAISSADQGVSAGDATNSDGTMSLALAIQDGQLSTVKRLLVDSDIDSEHHFEDTPLIMAAQSGHLDILQYLLFETGADYEATNAHGNNALAVAAFMGHTEAVRLLWSTIGTGIESPDVKGCTPLFLASAGGRAETVKHLLHDAGANAETTNNDGQGLLAAASVCGHLSVVKLLVTEVGADTGHASNTGMTPPLEASSRGHLQVLKYLLSVRSSSIYDRCSEGGTCLHHAAVNGRLKTIKYLHSETGINIRAVDRHGLDPRCWTLAALNRSTRELQSGSKGASQAKVDRLKTTEEYLKKLIN